MKLFYTINKFLDAVVRGDMKTVTAYLASDKSWANVQDEKSSFYAIHCAAIHGQSGIAQQLMEAGATVWRSDKSGQTPLHYATANGFVDIVKMLLEAGGEEYINATDRNGLSPLHYTIRDDRQEILKIFLGTGKANLNTAERPALYYAAESKRKGCVDILLAAGADPNAPRTVTKYEYDDDDYPYYSHHRHSVSKTTVSKYSVLSCACTQNQTEIAESLLNAGATVLPDEYPLHSAAVFGNIPLLTLLIQHGFDAKKPNGGKMTLLHSTMRSQACENKAEMVLFLLAQGVDKNALDSEGRTALSYAQQFALTDVVRILQDPLPAQVLAPVRPILNIPVLPTPVPPSPAPAPESLPPQDTETWSLAGTKSVVHATLYPALGRRLTEIFNFETRERIAITENFTLKTETMGPHENFDNIGDEALRKAFDEFRRLGGRAEENAVFGNRLMKMKMKPG